MQDSKINTFRKQNADATFLFAENLRTFAKLRTLNAVTATPALRSRTRTAQSHGALTTGPRKEGINDDCTMEPEDRRGIGMRRVRRPAHGLRCGRRK
ncbi:hypothetical protein BBSC_2485 [Bifidobacterium scardovii JCM 12489 = DSM 13734]|nr:hypothetical protein BBSC_2485 [Bifidobacterium scardovii JCM 12489 = DSM 13734]